MTAAPGLTYYPDSEPGIRRKRRGRGFSYIAPDGKLIRAEEERERFKKLAVPPAYRDVWISPLINGHLQATGRDAQGRKQYQYHDEWTAYQAQAKFDQLIPFGEVLPRIRRRVQNDLKADAGEQTFALAAAVTLIDRASLRVGNQLYTEANGTHGASGAEVSSRRRQIGKAWSGGPFWAKSSPA